MEKNSLTKAAVSLLIIVLLTGLSACGGDKSQEQLVKINDTVITNGQFDRFCMLWLYTQGFDPSEKLTSDQKSLALGDMINAEVLRQYYEEKDPSVLSDSYQNSLKAYRDQMKAGSAEFLSGNGISDEDIGFYYMSQYLTEKYFEDIRREYSGETLKAEAEKYYDEHAEQFSGRSFEESQEEIYYLLYSERYGQQLKEIKSRMTIGR